MNAVLDFPRIADPEPARTAVAVASSASIDLSKIDLTDPDPDAATKLPTGEVFERTDPQDGVGMEEVAPLVPAQPVLAATLTIGQINASIAPFTITTAALESMGLVRQTRPGPGVHFLATDMPKIMACGLKVFGAQQ